MELRARDHVLELTTALTVVSLAAVFGAVLGAIPSSVVPEAPATLLEAIPHINAALSTAAIVTILLGVRFIRQGNVGRHRAMMLTTLGFFVAFLVLYLYRLILVGTATFPGSETVYQFVYLPTLAIHILLAILCLPFVFYALLLAATRPYEELYHTRHAQVGFVAAVLWLISFTMGIGVYVMLYHAF